MSSKEKASELIVLYQVQCKSLDYQQAKECALIAVEELLTNCYEVMVPFWKEVKSELQSL